MRTTPIIFVIAIVWGVTAYADTVNEHEIIVNQALTALDSNYKSSWAYTRTSTKGENPTTLGRFDPSLPPAQQWTLISLGDRPPTAKEQKAWVARRMQNDEDNKSGFGNIVAPGSLQLVEESTTHWLFSFKPEPDKDDDKKARKLMSQVIGKLRVIKNGPYVEEILLFNEEPVRPAMGVKINVFKMQMSFAPIADEGPVVALNVDTQIEGRAYMAVTINEVKNVSFSDYQKVALPAKNDLPK